MNTHRMHHTARNVKTKRNAPDEICHACERDYTLEEGGIFITQVMIGAEPFGAPLGFPVCRKCYDKSCKSALACKVIEGKIRANNAEAFAAIEGAVRGMMQGLRDYRCGGGE